MYQKKLIGIVGTAMLFALSGCGSDSDTTNLTMAETLPITLEQASMPTNVANFTNEANDEPQRTDSVVGRNVNVPEGYELAIFPTEVQIGLADGIEIPLVASGTKLTFGGNRPVMKNGEVFVPLHGVFERLTIPANWSGISPFTVSWDEESSTATIGNSVAIVTIIEGDTTLAVANTGAPDPLIMPLNSPIQRINGELMVPLMPIAEAIMACVIWDDSEGNLHLFFSSYLIGGMSQDGERISIRPINSFVQEVRFYEEISVNYSFIVN